MPKDTPQWARKPKGWKKLRHSVPFQHAFSDPSGELIVITSPPIEYPDAAGTWGHISMSRKDQNPSYDDMCLVKRLFVGRRRSAIQVFPSEDEHVNIHPHCLHLWWRADGRSHPDLTMGMGVV